jgi:branched-chain amino acid transport system substrate-binding protein
VNGESDGESIKIGILADSALAAQAEPEVAADRRRTCEIVFSDAYASGLIQRPVRLIHREVAGLPQGSVKSVLDAFGDLVGEGCVAVVGPHHPDNVLPVREAVEERFHIPVISAAPTEDWLGEWTFSFPHGSVTDEPVFVVDLLVAQGFTEIGVFKERNDVAGAYLTSLQGECRRRGIQIVAVAETDDDDEASADAAAGCLRDANAAAIVYLGRGAGITAINSALTLMDWNPPRFTTIAFRNPWNNLAMGCAFAGWVAIDQYDEANRVGQEFLDRFAADHGGRRPENRVTVVFRDIATTLAYALADAAKANKLSPRGLRDSLEQVKMLPAATGGPGTRVSLGRWSHRAWMGPEFLVARCFDPDGINSRVVGRFGQFMALPGERNSSAVAGDETMLGNWSDLLTPQPYARYGSSSIRGIPQGFAEASDG